ncbi:lysine-specific demethylase 2A-like isoform X2 [Liolophura sinensis]|uniref:lysine-specific demethylase 2A-like isoform X2 n=1 Tax=Liolophura sinensis TaxID=3198878 RepID=UPI0031583579
MESGRKLRAKERKRYTDEDIDDDEIEGKRSFDVLDKLKSDRYTGDFVETLTGTEFTLKYVQETGLENPIVIHDKTGLGMRIPSANFQVSDVKQCVGSRRMLDVMDVNTQKGLEMSMKEWVKYYETKDRDRLLNVISLEFSHTRLETYVDSPTVVRQIDWVDTVWPRHLKEIHTEATNIIEKMKYPKVQKYCLMSVAGCYTDFHIDFGGTSVWYHILHGEKVFWLIPPTPENLEMYETWVLSGKQGDIFLADTVPSCQKIVLKEGYTFIIPSGWIHAVYTPRDSLVFGGNFIHSYNILQQLRVSEMEDRTRVPQKFRYPFYSEMLWYVSAQYLRCLQGKSYLSKPIKENSKLEKNGDVKVENGEEMPSTSKASRTIKTEPESSEGKLSNGIETSPRPTRSSRRGGGASTPSKSSTNGDVAEDDVEPSPSSSAGSKLESKDFDLESSRIDGEKPWVHLTPYELKGLAKLTELLESLPPTKRSVPKDLTDPDMLIEDMKALLKDHENDDPSKAVTGEEVIKWPPSSKLTKIKTKPTGGSKAAKMGKNAAGNRRRRTRCKKCPACVRGDCGECHFCKDMKKFGGPGRMKQSCISRQCMAPVLPNTATCIICETDERNTKDGNDEQSLTTLMECGKCWEIVHPACLVWKFEGLQSEGVINEDLPNSWECPKCCQGGGEGDFKARNVKDGIKDSDGKAETGDSEMSEEEETTNSKKLKKVEGKRVTSKVSKVSRLKSISLAGKRGRVKKSVLLSAGMKRNKVLPAKVKASLTTVKKLMRKGELPKGHISPPVVTRSGRTVVQKRVMEDDEMESPTKRQKREETISPPSRGRGFRGTRGGVAIPSSSVRGQGLRVRAEGSGRGRGRGRGRASKTTNESGTTSGDQSVLDSTGLSSPESSVAGQGSRGSTPVCSDRTGEAGKGKNKSKSASADAKEPVPKPVQTIPPKYVVRPASIPPPSGTLELDNGQKHILSQNVWQKIFQYLPHADLARCMSVCKTWNRWCIDKLLWYDLDLSHKKIKQVHLVGVVRRQPTILNLNYAVISPKQLSWLIERLPHVKKLSLAYCSWGTLSALCSSSCPLLTYLDLSWASGLRDVCFKDLISPAADHRPTVRIVSRLHKLVELQMAGTDISDSSLAIMPRHLTNLEKLDLSYCIKLTNKGIEYLTNEGTSTRYNLKELDLTGCNQLTDECLTFLANCPKLVRLKLKACHKISVEDCQAFTMTYAHRKLSLCGDFDKLIVCADEESST